jgi:hypothetical protein
MMLCPRHWLPVLMLAIGCSSPSPRPADIGPDLPFSPRVDARTETALLPPPGCLNVGTPGATARCLTPVHEPEYYVAQANAYFDTLDVAAPADSVPNYAPLVARWEWPPWLLLTGYGKQDMIEVSQGLKVLDPSTVPWRDCRFFPVQPFARCRVSFSYANGPCPIYEEFTFNDAGEMTFIEAWSDLPELLPLADHDPWGEADDVPRLATRIPGLGRTDGRIDLDSSWMVEAASADPQIADFALRASDWWTWWLDAVNHAEADTFAQGCGW